MAAYLSNKTYKAEQQHNATDFPTFKCPQELFKAGCELFKYLD